MASTTSRKRPARKPAARVRSARSAAPPLPRGARIDFSKLTLQDALDLAILVEEEAQERYQRLAEMVGGRYVGDASDVFRSMVKNEARHGAQLGERRELLFKKAKSRVSRDALFDVEAPDWSTVRVFMSAREALEVALRAEEKAFAFFDQALPHLKDAQVRKLFEELRGEERKHAAMLRQKMKGLPAGPDVEAEMADEPGSDPG
jgi:rubrerythrin